VANENDLNMIVTAAFVSNKGINIYQDIAGYVAEKLARDVNVISGTSYTESNLLLEQGIIQLGFVCGLPYTQEAAKGKLQLIAIPVMNIPPDPQLGTPGYLDAPGKYFSYTIVHKDSPLKSWGDLKGKSFVFNDQTSNSGYNMPRYKLVQLGAKSWNEYFSKIDISGSHEESIRMVSKGIVDASSVDSMVLDYDRSIKDPDAMNVKVIETLFPGGAGAPPVVTSKHMSAEEASRLTEIFTNMHKDEKGRAILKKALLLRFDPPDDSNYNDVRKMEKAARDAGFRDYSPQ
jgi:phosphonate transport system substrate-binding protein